MRRERGRFAPPRKRQVCKKQIDGAARHFRKGVPIEEQEWGRPMTAKQQLQQLQKRQLFPPRFFPEGLDFLVSFLIMPVLSASSFARSAVEADDKLPTPVFDKRGSGA